MSSEQHREIPARSLAQQRQDCLIALATKLSAYDFIVKMEAGRLVVRHPVHQELADGITCMPRAEDGMALWFYTSWREPICEASDLIGAVTRVKGYLVRRP